MQMESCVVSWAGNVGSVKVCTLDVEDIQVRGCDTGAKVADVIVQSTLHSNEQHDPISMFLSTPSSAYRYLYYTGLEE